MRRATLPELLVSALGAFLILTLATACAGRPARQARAPQSELSLKEAGARTHRLVGAAVDPDHLRQDPDYGATLIRQFNVLTTENALKFRWVQPREGQFDFSGGDTIVSFAQAHGMAVRGHNFVWHRGVPPWVTADSPSPEALASRLKNHIQTVVNHYKTAFPGVIQYWDVVNEAMGRDGALRTGTPWQGIGTAPTDYIASAFRWAHDADPALLLFYNDFSIEEKNRKSDAVYAMLRSLLASGVPIHGIGFQMHLEDGVPNDWDSMSENFDRFAALGLVIHVTELDDRLDLRAPGAPTAAQLQRQADVFGHVGALCVSKPACKALVNWGFTEKYSYIPDEQPGWGQGFILDADYQPKPAYGALFNALSGPDPGPIPH